jgi:hypothetical protein
LLFWSHVNDPCACAENGGNNNSVTQKTKSTPVEAARVYHLLTSV